MKLLALSIIFAAGTSFAAGECTLDIAKSNVQRVCALVKKDGKKPKTKDLLFENCGKNYIWIQDTDKDIKMVSHPIKRRLNNKSLTGKKDENGKVLFVEFDIEAHKVAKKAKTKGGRVIDLKKKHNNGWVDYMWAKPGAEKATPKTSYVELCEGPGGVAWIAGSGVWKEDLK